MCGIGGVVSLPGDQVSEAGLLRMGEAMAARGPDAQNLFIAPGVGLVHRRLSILDLSPMGNCPMPNEDGSIQVLLNGEIYNWRELRSELVGLGHLFRSMSDSEVISHGYEQWGAGVFSRLRGMFAVAIWDGPRARLLLARDRVGEKPLFYLCEQGATIFASTIPALQAYTGTERPISADALVCYLAHGFIPATHTVREGVAVFPTAHYATFDAGKPPTLCPYWQLPTERPRRVSVSQAEQAVTTVLDDSVHRCLDADVPVGVFLSGGVDSSLVAALAARHHPAMHSFSIGFDETAWNELPYARRVAEHLGLEHQEAIVRSRDVLRVLPKLVWHFGQPFGDPSAVPTFLVSELARREVTVALSGDGGDESFAGYWRVQAGLYSARYARAVPSVVRRHVVPLVASRLGRLGRRLGAMNTLSLAAAGRGYTNSQSWHDSLATIAGPSLQSGLAHERVACRVGRSPQRAESTTVIQRLLLDDFQVQLPDAYLTKVDVASMAASLEVRAPLLDVAVLEAAWRQPDRMKLHWGESKWLLKRIAARLVPRDVIYRRKMGFAMPLAAWFRRDLGACLKMLMADSVAGRLGWIDAQRARYELDEHCLGVRDHHVRLWLILWLELWFRISVVGEMDRATDLGQMVDLCGS